MAKSWLNSLEEMDMADKVDIAALRELLSKSTPHHWRVDEVDGIYGDWRLSNGVRAIAQVRYQSDAILIRDAINALPALLDELEAARAFRTARGMAVTDSDNPTKPRGDYSKWSADEQAKWRESYREFLRGLGAHPDTDSGDLIDFSHVPKGEAD